VYWWVFEMFLGVFGLRRVYLSVSRCICVCLCISGCVWVYLERSGCLGMS